MNDRDLRPTFAVVGAGVIGEHHATVLSQLTDRAELVAVVDVDLARARALAAARGGTAYRSMAEAFAARPIDVVAICTPTGRHGAPAIEALRAGKHVVLEKPAEIDVARTDEIIRARQAAGKLVTVISQHRFDPATERVLAAIERGEFGRLTSGIASIDWWRGQSYYDSGDWRGTWALDGGGALMNQGVHTVDLLIAALGRPVEVFAYTGTLAHERIEVEDVAVGLVRFASGALAVLHATTAAYPGLSARLQVHGDRGSAVIDNDELAYFHATPADPTAAAPTAADPTPAGSAAAGTASRDPGRLSGAHRRQYLNFLGALAGTEDLRVGLETNRPAIAVITGAYESARTGRPVVLD
ncbi:Gfo/Idh/MocA family oxidoreductase [Paractinoplanes ferrugineus]|uniref:Oxidoreductase n=1 Tax=Paractinoplanes ferrugineus TaxID=113564 RepID=A0A919M8G9_9ACTN|nr:Gfo/Idh/MocA family oxidoreductase [Actinoplanes ferrugineus]GIE10456.1 oxidoreductase [Actinoplanes ferrugineus]